MSHVDIVKKIKVDGDWKLHSIPRNAKGNYDWNALPEGLYLIEWRAGGKRRRESAGVTAAQALEAQRRKRHELEGRKLGVPGFETAGETVKKPALHVAVNKYLEQIEALKKPKTHRKYEAVLKRLKVDDRKSAMALLVAKTTIQVAKEGERDPERLCERVIRQYRVNLKQGPDD